MSQPTEDGPERSPDGRYVIVNGRRWRASDPSILEGLRAELVAELMAARRAVGAARRNSGADEDRESSARRRVQDAKAALGERGCAWWEPADDEAVAVRAERCIRALLRHRAGTSSICPSDVARIVGGERWRTSMETVRDAARCLAGQAEIVITSGSSELDPERPIEGPVRLRRGGAFPDAPPDS